jgi:hypothetical protein
MDMTVHSQQGHRNHALTRHDPGHSTMMTSIPPQQRGWQQLCHLTPRYENPGARAAHLHGTEAYRWRHGHDTSHQRTERPKDQRPVRFHATGELLPPDKEEDGYARDHFFAFLFHFSRFHHFTANVTRALPSEVIKREAGATSKERRNDQATTARTHLN